VQGILMASSDRPISAVLQDIVGNVQNIIRAEVRLAKTELTEELAKSRSAAVLLAAGALTLMFSALFVLLAIVYALSLVMPAWAAALVVGVGVGVVAALCVGVGMKRFKAIRGAPKTTATIKENVEWAKQLSK
jgi:uncharacterized membrane protein YqjE